MKRPIPLVDTSVLVRYLTGDDPEKAERAARPLEGEEVGLTALVLVETAYVLTSVYRIPRERVVDALMGLLLRKNLTPRDVDEEWALEALLLCCPSARVSFADALLWAQAGPGGVVYAFDARFPQEDLEVRIP